MKKFKWEQEQISHMKEYIARFGHGSAKLARQAQSKEKTLEKMVRSGLTEKVQTDSIVKIAFTDVPKLPPPVLQFSEVTFGYSPRKILYTKVGSCFKAPRPCDSELSVLVCGLLISAASLASCHESLSTLDDVVAYARQAREGESVCLPANLISSCTCYRQSKSSLIAGLPLDGLLWLASLIAGPLEQALTKLHRSG